MISGCSQFVRKLIAFCRLWERSRSVTSGPPLQTWSGRVHMELVSREGFHGHFMVISWWFHGDFMAISMAIWVEGIEWWDFCGWFHGIRWGFHGIYRRCTDTWENQHTLRFNGIVWVFSLWNSTGYLLTMTQESSSLRKSYVATYLI